MYDFALGIACLHILHDHGLFVLKNTPRDTLPGFQDYFQVIAVPVARSCAPDQQRSVGPNHRGNAGEIKAGLPPQYVNRFFPFIVFHLLIPQHGNPGRQRFSASDPF